MVLLLQVEELELCGRWKEEGAGKEEEKRMREKEGKEEKWEREGCEIQMSLGMVRFNSISGIKCFTQITMSWAQF